MNTDCNFNKQYPLVERVFQFINSQKLILKDETVLIGVSGGPDSVCLLHILVTLRERLGIRIHVAHLNHLLRGSESEEEAQYVTKLSEFLNVDITRGEREVRMFQATHQISLEEAAREQRYEFFAEVALAVKADRIAIGHNANDQAETIVMHLLRGSGSHGLQGMHPLTQWDSKFLGRLSVIRPLLATKRGDIEGYCVENSLDTRHDSSNLSDSFLRNRVRHELIPILQNYNPKVIEALLRIADSTAADASFFNNHISDIWDTVVIEKETEFLLKRKETVNLHPAIQRYLFREIIRRLLGDLRDIEWRHIEQIRMGLNLSKGKMLNLPRGLTFVVEQGTYRLGKN